MDSDIGGILVTIMFVMFILIIFGGLIWALSVGIKNGKKQEQELDKLVHQTVLAKPDDKKAIFLMQYNSQKKNSTTAILLALFLGGIGAHKFYLDQVGLGILYLLFCWSGIPMIVAVIELFTINSQVAQHNKKKLNEMSMYF